MKTNDSEEDGAKKEGGGPLGRARLLLDGLLSRVCASGGYGIEGDGDERALLLDGRVVARLTAGQGRVRVEVDPRSGAGDPGVLRRLGSPHENATLSAAGWRCAYVRTRADAARVVHALRPPRGDAKPRPFGGVPSEASAGRILVRRLLDPPRDTDGSRVLVDAEWPPRIDREAARVDLFLPEAAPSPRVREAFGLVPARDARFRRAYLSELRGSAKAEAVSRLRHIAREGALTLLTEVRDVSHSAAWVLARAVSKPKTPIV